MSKKRSITRRQKYSEPDTQRPRPIKFLGGDYIRLIQPEGGNRYSRCLVPPSSPKEIFLDYTITPLPDSFPKVKDLRLPKIRLVGVKAAIETLSQLFKCGEFKLNLLQFWFLDMLADCIWRAQDDYQFPEAQQKVIIEWVLYFFKLVKGKFRLFAIFCNILGSMSWIEDLDLSKERYDERNKLDE